MRLSAFILENLEPILQEWEDFARALGAVTESMDAKALRDHAKHILRDVAADLETYQSEAQQEAKAKGNLTPAVSEAADTGAEMHGVVRALEGFTLDQMLSEYRALRASVLRLWARMGGIDEASVAEQVTRFNEAIDEALSESAKRYARDVERLIAAANAKERMAALGMLSAGLGHDMSNVLMPMGVSLNQLEQAALPPESKLILESLRRAVEHLRGLTRGLQSLSADPEVKDASPATTRLHAWWAEAISPYKWSLAPGVKLHASGLDSTALPPVAIPRHVLMQAVFNLVQNASDALIAKGGGNIWLSAVLAEDAKAVLLAVRDDGPGMDPEAVGRCTEPFYTTKSRGRGTGLGLSLVRTAMERHRGRLLIESSPDHGSTFIIVLPVAEPGNEPHGARQATLTVGDLRVRAMITALLSNARVEVLSSQVLGGDNVGVKGTGATPRGFLWVVDGSVDPLDVLRFLDEAGPNVRVVALGKSVSTSPGSAGEAATQDGRLVQITDEPSHTTLQAALRRAVIGWAP